MKRRYIGADSSPRDLGRYHVFEEKFVLALIVFVKTLRELFQVADSAVVLERGPMLWAGSMIKLSDAIVLRFLGV